VAAAATPLPPTALPALPTVPAATGPEPGATPTGGPPLPSPTPTTRPGYFNWEQLIDDARELADAIESAHPDPYINGGSKIAFHRRLQRLLEAIPEDGIAREEFVRLLRPFVAVGDAQTEPWTDYPLDGDAPGVVPLHFKAVDGLHTQMDSRPELG
jgi:hypothetical protein